MSQRKRRSPWRTAIELALVALIFGIIGLRLWVYEPVRVTEISMEPTLYEGDVLLIDHLKVRRRLPPRGAVIVLQHPDSAEWVVKRVVAVENDRVGFTVNGLWRNGSEVPEPYIRPYSGEPHQPLEVPPGYVYVAGDNRPSSEDSRDYGPIPRSLIVGEVVGVWRRGPRGDAPAGRANAR